MDIEEAKQKVREHLQTYITKNCSEIWIGKIIQQSDLGFTIEAGIYAKGTPENRNATWFEVDAKSGAVEMCMID